MTQPARSPIEIWRRPLPELLPYLTEKLVFEERPKIRLPHGAFLSLSRRPNGQRILRIARDRKPVNERGEKMWRLELDTFGRLMGLEGWEPVAQAPIAGVAMAFIEPVRK